MSEFNTNGAQAASETAEATTETFRKVEAQAGKLFAGFDAGVPEAFREIAERTVTRSREAYENTREVMEEAVEALEKTLDKAGQGTTALNRKVIDITQANLNTGFDLAKDLAGARNIAEVMELQSSYVRKQFETLTRQAEEIRSLSVEVATNTASPFKAHVSRSIDKAASN